MDFKTKFKRNKGITLIALVVTIIVLLILAGISINMLTGQNGILNRASEARGKSLEAQNKEELEMAISELAMDYHVNGGADTFSDYIFAHEDDLKAKLGASNVSMNGTAKTITYKGTLYSVGTEGGVTRLDGIGLSETTKTLTIVGEQKEEFTLTATLTNISGTITWTTSNSNVATVTGSGETATVKAVGNGTTSIKASCNGKETTCEVTVKTINLAGSITISGETTVAAGGKIELTVAQTNNGNEEIEWSVDDKSKATVVAKEGTNGTTGIVTGVGEGTAVITATAKNSGKTDTHSVTVTKPSYLGQYFNYNVSYEDMYASKTYTAQNGWRILNMTEKGNGKYDVDIISTGIPAGLYYSSGSIASAIWAGTETQREKYVTDFYAYNQNKDNANVYAAAGLLNNFGSILFKGSSSSTSNQGYYKKITNGSNTYIGSTEANTKTGADLFLVSGINAKVRSVMHTDVGASASISSSSNIQSKTQADKTGVFRLDNMTEYASTGWYWLASPGTGNDGGVYYVYYNGNVNYRGDNDRGVRPVVSISDVKITSTGEGEATVWSIVP